MSTVSEQAARQLEDRFLGGLNDAQDAYEQIMQTEAWGALGYGSYIDWWTARVVPVMRALKMRPTREIVSAGIQQVRKEEAELPPLQRRTQEQLAETFGVSHDTVSRSTNNADALESDLDVPEKKEKKVPTPTSKRRPLPETAKEAALRLRKEIERLERAYEDDRFAQNMEQVATLTRSHLTYTIEAAQRLLVILDKESTSEQSTIG